MPLITKKSSTIYWEFYLDYTKEVKGFFYFFGLDVRGGYYEWRLWTLCGHRRIIWEFWLMSGRWNKWRPFQLLKNCLSYRTLGKKGAGKLVTSALNHPVNLWPKRNMGVGKCMVRKTWTTVRWRYDMPKPCLIIWYLVGRHGRASRRKLSGKRT